MSSLIVFNTCGISGIDNGQIYVNHIKTFLSQSFDGRIVVSGCKLLPSSKETLFKELGSSVSYNFIEDHLPVNVTFNHTVKTCEYRLGKFDSHVYVDSGVFLSDPLTIKKMDNLIKDYAIVTGQVDTDTGYIYVGSENLDQYIDQDFIVPIGKACNAHFNMYSRTIFDAFGKTLADVFAANCSESILSFVSAAVNQKWIICGDARANHVTGIDGGSVGFGGVGDNDWGKTFRTTKKMQEIISLPEMWECGMGYEECRSIFLHNENCYENGLCKDSARLKNFIQDNFFLTKEELDYEQINHQFVC